MIPIYCARQFSVVLFITVLSVVLFILMFPIHGSDKVYILFLHLTVLSLDDAGL